MARRYSRREFLIDASVALGSSVLLKVLAPAPEGRSAQLASKDQTATTQRPSTSSI
jgi:hypothetical protein